MSEDEVRQWAGPGAGFVGVSLMGAKTRERSALVFGGHPPEVNRASSAALVTHGAKDRADVMDGEFLCVVPVAHAA